jgi:hypothetical protein
MNITDITCHIFIGTVTMSLWHNPMLLLRSWKNGGKLVLRG